ncbi:MAG: hypothetical protein JXM71_02045, partial [Spirochaetales bacterium]|nr:hypothetical protein [Spirochaetales bacterium]
RAEALGLLDTILDSGVSVEQFVSDAVSFTRSLLFIASGVERESLLGAPRSSFPADLIVALDPPRLEKMLASFFDLYRDMRYSVNPRWELELAISRLCVIGDYISPVELARTIRAMKAAIEGGTAPGAAAIGAALGSGKVAAVVEGSIEVEEAGPAAPLISHDGNLDVEELKVALTSSVGKNRVVLSTCLQRSGTWSVQGDKLVIPCANGYDAGAVLAEAGLLAKKALEISGRPLRIEPRAMESPDQAAPVPAGSDGDGDDDGDDGPVDAVSMVERVFRGRRIGESRPATSASRDDYPE